MIFNTKILESIDRIEFASVQQYLLNKNWVKRQSRREFLAIFYIDNPHPTEILLPLSRGFGDYRDLILSAIIKISNIENREVDQVINDILLPPSDVLRFRVDNQRTANGLISFNEGFSLLENAKKSLFTTACDIIEPTFYHKRMSHKAAQTFIDSCFMGQTERGSFVASVVCPFIDVSENSKLIQTSLFSSEEVLRTSFTRTITEKYMKSLKRIKDSIESGNYDVLANPLDGPMISANFIESIIDLGDYGDNEVVEISASWSNMATMVENIPQSIKFTKDYIQPMEALVSMLKPKVEGKNGIFVGKVSRAQADPDPNNRNESEIVLNFIGDEDKIIRARVLLAPKDFSRACEALDKGLTVKISGVLKTSGKIKIIEEPHFELLESLF